MKRQFCIGKYVLQYRKKNGLTQAEFGKLLGVSAFAVSKWERKLSYPDIFLLPDIAALVGVSVDEMMGLR